MRSRRLSAPGGAATRPSSDRLRETLFNVLAPRMEGCRFLDLYAGSGAVGIEALSRGAASAVFVERAPPAVQVLRENLKALGLVARVEERSAASALGRLLKPGAGATFDVVFLDPPYEAEAEYVQTMGLLGGGDGVGLLEEGGVVVAEHASRSPLAEQFGRLGMVRRLRQGDATLSFYEVG